MKKKTKNNIIMKIIEKISHFQWKKKKDSICLAVTMKVKTGRKTRRKVQVEITIAKKLY